MTTKASKAAMSQNFCEIAPLVMDRLLNVGKYDAGNPLRSFLPRMDINQILGDVDKAGQRNAYEKLAWGLAEMIPDFYLDGTDKNLNAGKFTNALKYRGVEVNKRFPKNQDLLLIAYNPKGQVAGLFAYGYEQNRIQPPYPVKMIDSGGQMVPDFEYDPRITQRGMTFVFNTETKEWSVMRYRSGWSETSAIGDAVCDWSAQGRDAISEDSVDYHIKTMKHIFALVSMVEDEASLLFTEMGVGCALTMINGSGIIVHELAREAIFAKQRPSDWQDIVNALRRLFPIEVVDLVMSPDAITVPYQVSEIGRVRFITEANFPEIMDATENTSGVLTIEDVEKEGYYILPRREMNVIDIYNPAVNEMLAGVLGIRPLNELTTKSIRWYVKELARAVPNAQETVDKMGNAIKEAMSSSTNVGKAINRAEEENRMARRLVLNSLLVNFGLDITLLTKEDIMLGMQGTDKLPARVQKATAMYQSVVAERFFPNFVPVNITECRFATLDEDRYLAVMNANTVEGTAEADVSLYDVVADTMVERRVPIAEIINTMIGCQSAGSLVIVFNGRVGLLDSEMRKTVDAITHEAFEHDIFNFVKTFNDAAKMQSIGRREKLAESNDIMQDIPKAVAEWNGSEHKYHVQIATAVIDCVKEFGHNSIGAVQLNWVQEGLARKQFTAEEIGLGDDVLLQVDGRWFIAKEV